MMTESRQITSWQMKILEEVTILVKPQLKILGEATVLLPLGAGVLHGRAQPDDET